VGVEGATDGASGLTAVCLLPAGIEEGRTIDLVDRPLHLRIRQPVEFPLYTSSVRTTDTPGSLVPVDPESMRPLSPLRTVLASGRKRQAEVIPITLHAQLNDIGTLELWCSEVKGDRRWRLYFDVRATAAGMQPMERTQAAGATAAEELFDESTLDACCRLIHETFTHPKPPPGHEPERLMTRLEAVTQMRRETWPSSMLRRFWEAQMQVESGRRFSPSHEARWLNLAGFALRPGYGMAVDDWRVAQTWRLFQGRVKHARNEMCRAEWWILWRRIAGGLEAGPQKTLAEPLIAALRTRWRSIQVAQQKGGPRVERASTGPGVDFRFGMTESAEIWRLLGSLEWLDVDMKIDVGHLAFDLGLRRGPETVREACAWALGRLGARVPVYGPLNTLVPVETAEQWTWRLLEMAADTTLARRAGELPRSAVFSVVQMVRLTGDRYRDVSDELRAAVRHWLITRRAPTHFVTLVTEGGELQEDEQVMVFSESLLPGLKIA
jgi:hypothetical protein